jgi:hypothetical protein
VLGVGCGVLSVECGEKLVIYLYLPTLPIPPTLPTLPTPPLNIDVGKRSSFKTSELLFPSEY